MVEVAGEGPLQIEKMLIRREFSDLGTFPFRVPADELQTPRMLYGSFVFSSWHNLVASTGYLYAVQNVNRDLKACCRDSEESAPWHSILG
jgi:hypothetical protein